MSVQRIVQGEDTTTGGRSWKWKLRVAAWAGLFLFVISSAWWGPRAMSNLSFFRLQKVEVHGLRYLGESEFLKQLAVDTAMSIWMDLGPIEKRLEEHPQLLTVSLSRKLPGTLVVRVKERVPVALVARGQGFLAVDDSGGVIPVDPSSGTVDVPILHSADSVLIRLLARVRDGEPALYGRISEIAKTGKDEIRIELAGLRVLAMSDVTATRLLDILPVERDLAAKGTKVEELDLRYHGHVIARQVKQK